MARTPADEGFTAARQDDRERLAAQHTVRDLVTTVVVSTIEQVYGGRQMQAGEEISRARRIPRRTAEAMQRHAAPGFRIDIEEAQ